MYFESMSNLAFEWDTKKASSNLQKHGVSFDEAKTAFYDEAALVIDDPEHSIEEKRSILLGMSEMSRILIVVHCFRSNGDVIRIISARRASRKERTQYGRTQNEG